MGELYKYENTKRIVDKYDFVFKKKYGQNFLMDESILDEIIYSADINKEDVVLEIGPGIGTLTQLLADKAGHVIAIEIDKDLVKILENDTLKDYNNIEIIYNDILKMDIVELISGYKDRKVKVVANLPYYITTPIIMKLLESNAPLESITIMIQKEVAERLVSTHLDKDCGAISLAVQYHSEPSIVCEVSRNAFMPSPNVDSAVVRLKILKEKRVKVTDEELFFNLIKVAFGQRRKTLVNGINNQTSYFKNKEEILKVFDKLGFTPNIRGEKLSMDDYKNLAEEISQRSCVK
ncbi:MAG TPA: 16S rRNA (adenine(1518)-N(6)/adenine(1519)-N(6))-dimethyltransferase [Clostridiales bacterium]|nr:MAG: 16S rRNA (adenine(1518)-N(6)/adenine(1519)-N(6))-dimethyltransferase [Clostridiales bacterium GWD2_32_19]HCC07736.1 16S rRNA (adenine(1518)-N(6)/adenine(1519)-N(6))-dimethyltransferase [Clostridiales bacterium]